MSSSRIWRRQPCAGRILRAWLHRPAVTGSYLINLPYQTQVGTRTFYPVNPDESGNKDIGFSSLHKLNPDYTKRRGSIVQDEITVQTTTLDAYFSGKEPPDILWPDIWIDVEGAELEVLRGGKEVLRHSPADTLGSLLPADADRQAAVLGDSGISCRVGIISFVALWKYLPSKGFCTAISCFRTCRGA